MSKELAPDVVVTIKELIAIISGFEENTEHFAHILKYFTAKLKKSDTMYFASKREIDNNISGMSEKFCFHGFFPQSNALSAAYKTYLSELLPKSEMMSRLNVVKFLLCLSDSPTKHFLENPELHAEEPKPKEECDIDWGAYLNAGVEPWTPNFDETSEDDSDSSLHDERSGELSEDFNGETLPIQIKSVERICVMDLKFKREELLATIQHSWYNDDSFMMRPKSDWREANIGILWEEYLQDQFQGLASLKSSSIISEYKVIREILWQIWKPHNSCTIQLVGNSIKPRPDVSLASIRSYAFYNYMNEFLSYIELMDLFRKFDNSLQEDVGADMICRTYQSYGSSIRKICDPIYKRLSELEDTVRQQESTFTLLNLASELRIIMQPLKILKDIHDQVTIDYIKNSPLNCATILIARLHESLSFTTNKLEQDLKLTLFIDTVFYYISLVDSWLMGDDLADYAKEFVVEKIVNSDPRQAQFVAKNNVSDHCRTNTFLKIFMDQILTVGRNISFLRLLGQYDVIGDSQEPIYNEFLREIFKELQTFPNEKDESTEMKHKELTHGVSREHYIFPVVETGICRSSLDMQKQENLVDVEDGFLMAVFADFFGTKPEIEPTKSEPTLYEKITNSTTGLCPNVNFFETILLNIIERRFTVSGLMVKNLLIEEHLLEKQFQYLRHLYLFFDDIIFPFYRRLFEKNEHSRKYWSNTIWLTSHLQDIFMDMYPEFYEKCSVQVKDELALCADSNWSFNLINVNYDMPWPISIIINQQQMESYKMIFKFLLNLKWALYTVNHLMFTDMQPKAIYGKKTQKSFKVENSKNKITGNLFRLKFSLINILNNLQHFVFGYVFQKNLLQFELEFEKAYDLNSLIKSHDGFIRCVSGAIEELQYQMYEKDKNNNIFVCIKLLKLMWDNSRYATLERIIECDKIYNTFFTDISRIIFPNYVYDY
ncbi:gamma-tubulin complex component 5 [Dendroctonus ponderosae]|nr:gamma-tubulin complex component 5 [Dendroctonus ponderosae]KAH1019005.1 hypothetical protein HUJ05_006672 [Dendroctonus ponderosae]